VRQAIKHTTKRKKKENEGKRESLNLIAEYVELLVRWRIRVQDNVPNWPYGLHLSSSFLSCPTPPHSPTNLRNSLSFLTAIAYFISVLPLYAFLPIADGGSIHPPTSILLLLLSPVPAGYALLMQPTHNTTQNNTQIDSHSRTPRTNARLSYAELN
jgi:hypothetical protein